MEPRFIFMGHGVAQPLPARTAGLGGTKAAERAPWAEEQARREQALRRLAAMSPWGLL